MGSCAMQMSRTYIDTNLSILSHFMVLKSTLMAEVLWKPIIAFSSRHLNVRDIKGFHLALSDFVNVMSGSYNYLTCKTTVL